ncbi:MAG: hypothetical protein ACJASM_001772 [Salibacteraceae bacterium]|jgi:hypothetical protein
MGGKKQIIQNLYTYFKTGEGEKIAALFHSDIEWKQMEGFPNGEPMLDLKKYLKTFLDNLLNIRKDGLLFLKSLYQ